MHRKSQTKRSVTLDCSLSVQQINSAKNVATQTPRKSSLRSPSPVAFLLAAAREVKIAELRRRIL